VEAGSAGLPPSPSSSSSLDATAHFPPTLEAEGASPIVGSSSPLVPGEWSVTAWLASIDMSRYAPVFLENDLLHPTLIKELTNELLKTDLGVKSLGDRLLLLKAIKDL
jgi:hypothetical protein